MTIFTRIQVEIRFLVLFTNSILLILLHLLVFFSKSIQLASVFEARWQSVLLVLPTFLLNRVIIIITWGGSTTANLIVTLHEVVLPDVPAETHIYRSALLEELSLRERFRALSLRRLLILLRLLPSFLRSILLWIWAIGCRCPYCYIRCRTSTSWACTCTTLVQCLLLLFLLFESDLFLIILLLLLLFLGKRNSSHRWRGIFKGYLLSFLSAHFFASDTSILACSLCCPCLYIL